MDKRRLIEQAAIEVTKEFSDRGLLIEAGWAAYRAVILAKAVPLMGPTLESECRQAYMAGAEHLFSSIMVVLEPGDEPSDADLNRMSLIQTEIEVWRVKLWDRVHPNQGRG